MKDAVTRNAAKGEARLSNAKERPGFAVTDVKQRPGFPSPVARMSATAKGRCLRIHASTSWLHERDARVLPVGALVGAQVRTTAHQVAPRGRCPGIILTGQECPDFPGLSHPAQVCPASVPEFTPFPCRAIPVNYSDNIDTRLHCTRKFLFEPAKSFFNQRHACLDIDRAQSLARTGRRPGGL